MYWRQSRVKGSEETKFQYAGQKLIKAMVIKRTGISTLELGTPLTLTVMGGICCQEEHFPKSLILYNGLFICFPIFFPSQRHHWVRKKHRLEDLGSMFSPTSC